MKIAHLPRIYEPIINLMYTDPRAQACEQIDHIRHLILEGSLLRHVCCESGNYSPKKSLKSRKFPNGFCAMMAIL